MDGFHNHSYLEKDIEQIQKDILYLDPTELEKKWNQFKEKYPKTWASIQDNTFDLEEFKHMNRVFKAGYDAKKGDTHQDARFRGDISLGNYLANKYGVYNGRQPTSEDLNKAFVKAKAKHEINKSETVINKSETTKSEIAKTDQDRS